MCIGTPPRSEAKASAEKLARLMERQLGYVEGHIDSIALRLFVTAYFDHVAPLVHAIHDNADN